MGTRYMLYVLHNSMQDASLRYYYIFIPSAACDPGYYLTNNNCEKCPYDKYQPDKWQSSCIECPTSYVTQKQGATNESDCVGK